MADNDAVSVNREKMLIGNVKMSSFNSLRRRHGQEDIFALNKVYRLIWSLKSASYFAKINLICLLDKFFCTTATYSP